MEDLSKLKVIFEDNHLIAVNKPAGYLVHGDGSDAPVLTDLVKAYIKIRYDKPGDVFLGVIHRLDRVVSGLVIFARTSKALERMNKMMKERTIEKTYLAITDTVPPENKQILKHWLLKDEKKNKVKVWDQPPGKKGDGAKIAELEYELKMNYVGLNLLKVNLKTGRPHQIRAQLSAIGCPIKFDKKYGYKKSHPSKLILLHAYKMSFLHPVRKKQITIVCSPPKSEGWELFDIAHLNE